ncbi:MAG TPA: cupin domain-containing protein [Oceanithermus profundus]|uniref:Cupin domain-containing protein n=1 Tax=Oceanithermus profundus TaxID=187137 RepID=A0A7C4ZI36_9DEIN|nr:cupin domain-containing protein [Oceanithermus profundus]
MEIRVLEELVEFNPEKMKKIPVFDSEHMFYDLYALLPGQMQKVHAHEESDKVYLVLAGEARVQVGEEQATLTTGQAVRAPAGAPHGVWNASEQPVVLLVVMAPKPA